MENRNNNDVLNDNKTLDVLGPISVVYFFQFNPSQHD